ncbi:XRE family transcriptional regulator [Chamaesiphon minutus]|uniref:Putative Zn peptidase n=1 Tax=Chamaesiphon minutus (strain ATCC 27169 / PCC 6605) TaxID=1173020 RepID=K9UPY6_CHAP6|nr:XRE family transcriptional regulator [Chamaesiphon minutus]AFY96865.1 putative Zn peptidase [Chamaesiphon minutus PCC 6605]
MSNQIRAYRDQLGFKQEELGEQAGVTRQTIAAWENGEREPSLVQLSSIARIMGVAVELLQGLELTDSRDPNSFFSSLLFRADEPSALTPTIKQHLIQKVADYAAVEKLLGEIPVSPAKFPLDGYESEVIEDYSKEVRNWLGLGESAPVGDSLSLLESKGLKVLPYPLPAKISGFSACEEDWGCLVVVNSNDVAERQFFTSLHELAHLIFHHKEYRQPPERTKSSDPREKAANHLAGAILLPKNVIRREMRAYRDRWIPDPLLIDIKRRYGVSLRTILIRAEQAGIITKQQSGTQMGVLNKKCGGKDKDLPNSEIPMPQRLTRLERLTYTALLEDEPLTISRAAEILGKKTSEVHQELQTWKQYDVEVSD